MRLRFVFALILLLAPAPALTDAREPLAGARRAFAKFLELNAAGRLRSPEGRALLAGEFAGNTSPSFGKIGGRPDDLRLIDEDSAVARVLSPSPRPVDVYIYLERPGSAWRLEAYRTTALTALPEQLRSRLRAKRRLSAKERAMLAQLDLQLATDAQIRAWFNAHRPELEALRRAAETHMRAGRPGREPAAVRVLAGEAPDKLGESHAGRDRRADRRRGGQRRGPSPHPWLRSRHQPELVHLGRASRRRLAPVPDHLITRAGPACAA